MRRQENEKYKYQRKQRITKSWVIQYDIYHKNILVIDSGASVCEDILLSVWLMPWVFMWSKIMKTNCEEYTGQVTRRPRFWSQPTINYVSGSGQMAFTPRPHLLLSTGMHWTTTSCQLWYPIILWFLKEPPKNILFYSFQL